jgi:hypothetical protein
MRNYITFRSTLSNASWIQRGAAALLMAALMFTLTLALRPSTHAPASTPAVRQAAPAAHNPNMPLIGTGSAYDGGAYVTERPAVRNPNVPVIGTGSAYDGRAYVTERPAVPNPNMPVIGTGSAYDGQ